MSIPALFFIVFICIFVLYIFSPKTTTYRNAIRGKDTIKILEIAHALQGGDLEISADSVADEMFGGHDDRKHTDHTRWHLNKLVDKGTLTKVDQGRGKDILYYFYK